MCWEILCQQCVTQEGDKLFLILIFPDSYLPALINNVFKPGFLQVIQEHFDSNIFLLFTLFQLVCQELSIHIDACCDKCNVKFTKNKWYSQVWGQDYTSWLRGEAECEPAFKFPNWWLSPLESFDTTWSHLGI